jgi:hypothetical protein
MRHLFSFRVHLGECRFHDLGRSRIGVSEHMPVNFQGDRRVCMPQAAVDRQHVQTGGDELVHMGVTKPMEGTIDLRSAIADAKFCVSQ